MAKKRCTYCGKEDDLDNYEITTSFEIGTRKRNRGKKIKHEYFRHRRCN